MYHIFKLHLFSLQISKLLCEEKKGWLVIYEETLNVEAESEERLGHMTF